MTVGELREALSAFPEDFHIHIDIYNEELLGERRVFNLSNVRIQEGYNAVALDVGTEDASALGYTEQSEAI